MRSLLQKKEYFDILAFQIRNTTFDFYPFTGKAPCDPKQENGVPVDIILFSVPPLHQLLSEGTDWQKERFGGGAESEAMVQRKVSSCLCRRQMSTHLITTSGPHWAAHNSWQRHVYCL